MTVTQNLPRIEYVDVDEERIVVKLENDPNPRPIILKFIRKEDGKRYYDGPNSTFLSDVYLSGVNPKTAQLLTSSPDYGVHAVLHESTLNLGTAVLPAGVKWGDHRDNSPYFHCSINLTRSGNRFLPMELVDDMLVPTES
jgi:hypothetical protein